MMERYNIKIAEQVVQEIDHSDLRNGHDGWITIMKAGCFSLARVDCHSTIRDGIGLFQMNPIIADQVPIQRPIGMPYQGPGLRPSISYPALSIACLREATCVPGGIILRDDVVLANSFSAQWDTHRHRHMTSIDGQWQLNPDREFRSTDLQVIDTPALYLDDQHIDWFGHVVADLLSPGWAYEYCKVFLKLERLLVLVSMPKFDFVRQLILSLEIPTGDIAFISRPVKCRRLYVASKAFQIQDYISPPSVRMWQGVRSRLLCRNGRQEGRIYVSRRANPTRRLMEEGAVEEIFASLGFYILYPEAHTIYQQMDIFARAQLIAGCSGSNMFNIAVARARAVLIMVSPLLVHYSEQFFSSRYKNGNLDMIVGYTLDEEMRQDPGFVHAPWHLEPSLIRRFVVDWISRNT